MHPALIPPSVLEACSLKNVSRQRKRLQLLKAIQATKDPDESHRLIYEFEQDVRNESESPESKTLAGNPPLNAAFEYWWLQNAGKSPAVCPGHPIISSRHISERAYFAGYLQATRDSFIPPQAAAPEPETPNPTTNQSDLAKLTELNQSLAAQLRELIAQLVTAHGRKGPPAPYPSTGGLHYVPPVPNFTGYPPQ